MRCLSRSTIQALIDRELEGATIEAIESHLESCRNCREQVTSALDRVNRVRRELHLWSATGTVPSFHEVPSSADHIQHRPHRLKKAWRSSVRVPVPIAVAVIVVFLVMGAAVWHQNGIVRDLTEAHQTPSMTVVTVATENMACQQEIPLDLSKCRPIRNPEVFVFQEE